MEETWWTRPEQLDGDQRAVVALPEDEDHLVTGPPGSGKTNLLVLRAAYMYASGVRNIAVLTFGRVLREFLVAGSTHYEMPPNLFQTYIGWGTELLRENEIPYEEGGEFDEQRARLLVGLQSLAQLSRPETVLDCLLIDEAQDYTAPELETLRRFTNRLFIVGDDKQRIYRGAGGIEYLEANIASTKRLSYHYRNGLKICRLADHIRNVVGTDDAMELSSNYDEKALPSGVVAQGGLTIAEQVARAVPEIGRQLRAYPEAFIGVLCPRNREVTEVWGLLRATPLSGDAQLHQSVEGYEPFDITKRVVVGTTHGAKGLEFRALHLLGMDKIVRFTRNRKRLAFTAVTRAKTSLAIYHEQSLPPFLDQAITAVNGVPAAPPQLADLFRPSGGANR